MTRSEETRSEREAARARERADLDALKIRAAAGDVDALRELAQREGDREREGIT